MQTQSLNETVKTGAAATRRTAKGNPLEMLAALRTRHRTDGFEAIYELWLAAVERDKEAYACMSMYAFRNYWSTLDRNDRADMNRQAEQKPHWARRAEAQATTSKEAGAKAERTYKMALLQLTLPSGKSLEESTFADCAKAGGFFTRVSKLGKPTQVVGQTVTEDQLQALLGRGE